MASISLGMAASRYNTLTNSQKIALVKAKKEEAVRTFGGNPDDWQFRNPLGGEFGNQLILENTSVAGTSTQTPGVLASPLPDTQGGNNLATYDVIDSQGRVVASTTDPAAAQSQGSTTRLQSGTDTQKDNLQQGDPLTPQDIITFFRRGELDQATTLTALVQLFGGNRNSATAYFTNASTGQAVSISQENGVWSLQTNQPQPLDTSDLDREIFGNNFDLNSNRNSFLDFLGETQEGRGQVFRGALANMPERVASPFRGFLERQFPRVQNEFILDQGLGGSSAVKSFQDFLEDRPFQQNFGNPLDRLRQVAGLFDAPPDSLSNTQQGFLEFLDNPTNSFNLALQSTRPSVAAPFRRSFDTVARRNFDRDIFNNPEANFFQTFANRGFSF